jgi:hypothetical protein
MDMPNRREEFLSKQSLDVAVFPPPSILRAKLKSCFLEYLQLHV